jgi:hypothetical protein
MCDIKYALEDLREKYPLYRQNMFSFFEDEETLVVDKIYLRLYESYPEDYRGIFSVWHGRLNDLFKFMNQKAESNGHYNANESHELLELIKSIGELRSVLSKKGIEFRLAEIYDDKLKEVSGFLQQTCGSVIPDTYHPMQVEKYSPIFFINDDNLPKIIDDLGKEFNDDYLRTQLNQMYSTIESNPADAIGKAKSLIESCFKTILDRYNEKYDKTESIPSLNKKVNNTLDLKSENKQIKKVISHVSGLASSLGELRNNYSADHGRSIRKFKPPSRIEARLAVDISVTLVRFYWEINKTRDQQEENKDND